MSKKIVIVCLGLLFCGGVVGQVGPLDVDPLDVDERTKFLRGVSAGLDFAIGSVTTLTTKEAMLVALWAQHRDVQAQIEQVEKETIARNKESEEYNKRMMERIEAADSTEEFDKLIEEIETDQRRIEKELEELDRKMK